MLAIMLQIIAWVIWSRPARPNSSQRLEQRDAERPVLEQADRQPARARQRRQQQRVAPDREAREQARQRAARACRPSRRCRPAAPARTAPPRRRRPGRWTPARRPRRQAGSTGSRAAGSARSRRAGCRAAARSGRAARPGAGRFSRSSTGITRSLQTMVESAMVSTITMPVAADRPPMKTSSASSLPASPPSAASARRCRHPRCRRKMQHAAEGDRQHEHVDRQHVEREQPDRLVQVLLVRCSRSPPPGTGAAGT